MAAQTPDPDSLPELEIPSFDNISVSDAVFSDGVDELPEGRPTSPSPPPMSRSPSPELDDVYNLQSVVFQAERRIFQVLKQGFMAPGTKFEPILADPTNNLGKGMKTPIILDATVPEFRAFLRVLYPFWNFGSYEEESLDINDWAGVLRLAKKWNFTKIGEKAVAELTRLLEGKHREMIRLGQQLGVESWLRQGLVGLAEDICKNDWKPSDVVGDQPLFIENEWAHVANLFFVCQSYYKRPPSTVVACHGYTIGMSYAPFCPVCQKFWGTDKISELVNEIFAAELAKGRPPPDPEVQVEHSQSTPLSSTSDASRKKKKKMRK